MQSRSRLVAASIVLACVAGMTGVAFMVSDPCPGYRLADHDPPSEMLLRVLGDVTTSRAHRYSATDTSGHRLDCLDPIEVAPGEYYGVHHHFNGTSFAVHLVHSSNLFDWEPVAVLAVEASMPAIEQDTATGAFYLAHEQWQGANTTAPCWIAFRYYPDLAHLRDGNATRSFQTPKTLSDLEGTPAFYSISPGGDDIHVGFHYNGPRGLDKVANGTLRCFHDSEPSWVASSWIEYNRKLECLGISGHIGARATGSIGGRACSVQEAQARKDDWASWQSFVYCWDDGGFWPLDIKTHGGSRGFSNPHFRVMSDPLNASQRVVFTTYFIHADGAAPGEAGPLLFLHAGPAGA